MLEGLINEYISKADDWNRIFSKMKFRTFFFVRLTYFYFLLSITFKIL
ncbi:hypothetical protein TREVI0001_0225 [Treponema vincentii ATCC 35580]|uniref:Uncharacterized protein n=1 Tax=Treponema vincentii ATCC 35580 TaxID=596324 RepID=C8PTY2_9SPIR|nr:hypothetical protein TREVI0001_0225 [Treponema vincentii ATCC 35580]